MEKSHEIMEQARDEFEKEKERLEKQKIEKLEKDLEKLKESENTDLSAPNKIPTPESGKNLTSKQKAALVRQQKLAKAKSVTNKALKKTSESKSSQNAKEKRKYKPRVKQPKAKSVPNFEHSIKKELDVVDVVGISIAKASEVASLVMVDGKSKAFFYFIFFE